MPPEEFIEENEFSACSFTPSPREGAAFNLIKKNNEDTFILFGGKDSNENFHETWELTLDPSIAWAKVSDELEIKNSFNGFIQQVITPGRERTLLVGGLDENNDSDHPTKLRDYTENKWIKITKEDKIESFDSTPDTVDWVGEVKVEDTKGLASDINAGLMISWQSGSANPLKYHHPNTYKWRPVYNKDRSKIIHAFGSYVWVEYATATTPTRLYVLGGYDKDGNTLKKFQRIDLRFDSNQPPPFPPNPELFYYTNHTILADENDPFFILDPDTPLFEGNPLIVDGIATLRTGNNASLRINTPNTEITTSTSTPLYPLNTGVWDDALGWVPRSDLETHVVIPFSTFAEVRLIEIYILKSTGEIKARIPLEDFDPHPELPQTRRNFSFAPLSLDNMKQTNGFLIFGGSIDDELQNDLWKIDLIDIGTNNQRFIWSRLN